jgi:hypothetical protein
MSLCQYSSHADREVLSPAELRGRLRDRNEGR